MDLKEAIYAYLIADAPLFALVGLDVYPGQPSQDVEFPYVTYRRIWHQGRRSLARRLRSYVSIVQFTVFAGDALAAERTWDALREALVGKDDGSTDGFEGTHDGGNLTVQLVSEDGSEDFVSLPIHADEFGTFSGDITLTIHWSKI